MSVGKAVEWVLIAAVALFALRWLAGLLDQGTTVQSSNYYAPGYPQQPVGYVGYYGFPGVVYSTGTWWTPRPRRGYPGGSTRW